MALQKNPDERVGIDELLNSSFLKNQKKWEYQTI